MAYHIESRDCNQIGKYINENNVDYITLDVEKVLTSLSNYVLKVRKVLKVLYNDININDETMHKEWKKFVSLGKERRIAFCKRLLDAIYSNNTIKELIKSNKSMNDLTNENEHLQKELTKYQLAYEQLSKANEKLKHDNLNLSSDIKHTKEKNEYLKLDIAGLRKDKDALKIEKDNLQLHNNKLIEKILNTN